MKEAAVNRAGRFKKIGLITKHFMPNTLIEALDERTANTTTQALITWQLLEKDTVPRPVQAGYYQSRVSKTPEGWKFASRDVRLSGVFSVKACYGELTA